MISLDGRLLPCGEIVCCAGRPTDIRKRDLARGASTVDVLTPPSILAVLRRGYGPLWHPSATR